MLNRHRPIVVTQKDKDRFESKVEKLPNGCWEWRGSFHHKGYGYFSIKHRIIYAHRFAYVAYCGEIPFGMLVCHSCDNPICVSPEHIFLGTPKDNTHDMIEKGRMSPGQPRKLRNVVSEIRRLYATGEYTTVALAEMFGTVPDSIDNIILGKTHRDVNGVSLSKMKRHSDREVAIYRGYWNGFNGSIAEFVKDFGIPFTNMRNIVRCATYPNVQFNYDTWL